MIRPTWHDFPPGPTPAAQATMARERLEFRAFSPGDERHWLDIHHEADHLNNITDDLYERAFGPLPGNLPALRQRQLFLWQASGGPCVGTVTAWWGHAPWEHLGRVHWLALCPAYQSMGLGGALLHACCMRLRELGHVGAYLTTDARRPHALRLYERHGFTRV